MIGKLILTGDKMLIQFSAGKTIISIITFEDIFELALIKEAIKRKKLFSNVVVLNSLTCYG